MKGVGEETGDDGRSFLLLWWFNQVPYVARFQDEMEAEMAAKVRNAVIIEVRGEKAEVVRVVDYYRRDEEGNPIPATWKDLADKVLNRAPFRWPSLI